MVRLAWIMTLFVALTFLPVSSAYYAGDAASSPFAVSAFGPVRAAGREAASGVRASAPDLPVLDMPTLEGLVLDVGVPGVDAGCTPAVVLARDWFGGVPVEWRHQDQQMLAPVAVVGEVTRLVPTVGGLLLPVTQTLQGVVDVAVRAAWDEEFIAWASYTDRLTIGLGAHDPWSLQDAHLLQSQGWRVEAVELQCGARSGLSYERDPASGSAAYSCVTCTAAPESGWYLQNIVAIDVWVAKAEDLGSLPPMSQVVCPDEVAAAVQERVDGLGPTVEDALNQQGQRVLAGLPRTM